MNCRGLGPYRRVGDGPLVDASARCVGRAEPARRSSRVTVASAVIAAADRGHDLAPALDAVFVEAVAPVGAGEVDPARPWISWRRRWAAIAAASKTGWSYSSSASTWRVVDRRRGG